MDYIFILLETGFVPELHSNVCRCTVELVLEGNILLCNEVLSIRLIEYLKLKDWTNLKMDILSVEIYIGHCRADKNLYRSRSILTVKQVEYRRRNVTLFHCSKF